MIPVQKWWPGQTFAILAGGPSLTQADVDTVKSAGCRIIAIKDAIRLCPDADVLYACDAKWWKFHGPKLTYTGPKYALEAAAKPWADVLAYTGEAGLDLNPSCVRTGKNSGYQAINLAVHLGATRILLLGFDMQPVAGEHHWFGRHPYPTVDPPYDAFRKCFATIVAPLRAAGVDVINVTPRSALDVFPCASLAAALTQVAA